MRIKATILFSMIAFLGGASLAMAAAEENSDREAGRAAAFDRMKGNCLACHAIPSDPQAVAPGNIGRPLVDIKKRFPDRAKVRAQIWDATVAYPNSPMPPFGRNKVLTEKDVDQVTDYVYGL